MNIRLVTPEDIDNIQLLVKTLAHCYLDDPANNLPDWLENSLTHQAFLNRLSDTSHDIYIAEENLSVVGYIALKHCGNLYHLFVDEQHHNKGIARALWQHAKHRCPSNNYWLRSSIFAVPVYKRLGFSEFGPVETKDGISFQPMAFNEASIGQKI